MLRVCFTPCPKCKPSLFALGHRTPAIEATFYHKSSLFCMIFLFVASLANINILKRKK